MLWQRPFPVNRWSISATTAGAFCAFGAKQRSGFSPSPSTPTCRRLASGNARASGGREELNGPPSGSHRGFQPRRGRNPQQLRGSSPLWVAASTVARGEARLAQTAGQPRRSRRLALRPTARLGGLEGELAIGRYGRGALLRSGTAIRRSSRRVTQKMGIRRYTAWLRRRRRQPYKGVGGASLRRSRRRIGALALRLNAEQLYRSKGTMPSEQRYRMLNAGRGAQPQRLPAQQSRSLDYAATNREHPSLQLLRRRVHYYRQPRRRLLWYARRFGRLALRKRHHRRSKRMPRLLAQRLLLLANLHPLLALQRRWLSHCLGTGAGLGLADPARLSGASALLLGLLRLQPRRRGELLQHRRSGCRSRIRSVANGARRRRLARRRSTPATGHPRRRAARQLARWRHSTDARRRRLARRRRARRQLARARRLGLGRLLLMRLALRRTTISGSRTPLPHWLRHHWFRRRERRQQRQPMRYQRLQQLLLQPLRLPPTPLLQAAPTTTQNQNPTQRQTSRGGRPENWRQLLQLERRQLKWAKLRRRVEGRRKRRCQRLERWLQRNRRRSARRRRLVWQRPHRRAQHYPAKPLAAGSWRRLMAGPWFPLEPRQWRRLNREQRQRWREHRIQQRTQQRLLQRRSRRLEQRRRRPRRALWYREGFFRRLGHRSRRRSRPHRRNSHRALNPRRQRRSGRALAPWLRRLLWLRHRRHVHRRGWVRQRSIWRRSPLQRLLRHQLRRERRGRHPHRWNAAALRRPRRSGLLPVQSSGPLGRLRMALTLSATPGSGRTKAAAAAAQLPATQKPSADYPNPTLKPREESSPLQLQLQQRLGLLAQLAALRLPRRGEQESLTAELPEDVAAAEGGGAEWWTEGGAAPGAPEAATQPQEVDPEAHQWFYVGGAEGEENPEAEDAVEGEAGENHRPLPEGSALLLLQRRLRRRRRSPTTEGLLEVATAAAAPLLNTLQRQGLPISRLLRQRRVDRSENLSHHYAPSVLRTEELYKFSWLAAGLAEKPVEPQLWHRQRRQARLRDYTLRRDEDLWWRERLQEWQRLQRENRHLAEEWAEEAQEPFGAPQLEELLQRRLPYALLSGLLALEGQLTRLLPPLAEALASWKEGRRLAALGLLAGSAPLSQLLRRSDWNPRALPGEGPVYHSGWRHDEEVEWLEEENRYPLREGYDRHSGQLRVRPEGRGPGGAAYSARHYLQRLLRRLSLRLILSPRRNNVYVVLQPDNFRGRAGEVVFQRTAGEQSRFKGRLRRSRQNRQQLYGLAAFRLLRFHKQNSRYRFLRVVLKGFHSTLTRRQRNGFQRQRYLRSLLYPFTKRQMAQRYPLVALTLQGYSYQPKRQTRRSKKHPRPPKNKSYF